MSGGQAVGCGMLGRMITMRRYAGPEDLRAMQSLTERIWSLDNYCHVGDQAWERTHIAGREALHPTALWEDGGEVVAWGWAFLPDGLHFLVDPARPELADEVLRWFDTVAESEARSITLLDRETHLRAALERQGYRLEDSPVYSDYMRLPLDDLPEPVAPQGFRLRHVEPGDLARRVAVHQAAWQPSKVTEESYRTAMGTWPYRSTLDWVAEAEDDTFAASCLIWLDERNRVGELEPVGTDPRFRRRGLARAVCLAALGALRDAGADQAVVYPVRGLAKAAAAAPLYEDLGFVPYGRTVTYVR
ncbi:Ribosomal protein S18 acetylase RimI [Amycolatopsis xylanica]|uniref:Ribosomal protein S18 acetylase RimI n=1 Tax=Amycolatopsis xylanica TaxID=589385 RepID=A0A1H3GJ74_9PSEU|nr:GNAT family N-acetyltransferase [Amycolatopsis xylanica]SDY03373.1 Ribosomal protein S18 acetylase RimI [Amycolatopsis xylanica]